MTDWAAGLYPAALGRLQEVAESIAKAGPQVVASAGPPVSAQPRESARDLDIIHQHFVTLHAEGDPAMPALGAVLRLRAALARVDDARESAEREIDLHMGNVRSWMDRAATAEGRAQLAEAVVEAARLVARYTVVNEIASRAMSEQALEALSLLRAALEALDRPAGMMGETR